MKIQSKATHAILGDIIVPGDKSISHRAVILSSIANASTTIENILLSDDVLATIAIMQSLGVTIEINHEKNILHVHGVGLQGLKPSRTPLNCGNSGTTMRLLCGLLSAQQFNSLLIGDESLMRRPMLRVAEPLRLMGAKIALSENNTAPIKITGNTQLQGMDYTMPVASAQVKSAILLASLYAKGKTQIYEPVLTRDHTERMMRNKNNAIQIPGDISSAAFFIVAAAITPHSDLIIRSVGINPFRTGIIAILRQMGADISLFNEMHFGLEPVADIRIRYKPLQGITIPVEWVVNAIDEFPAIFIAAVTAKGNTVLHGAKELRVKESDRIATMCAGLKKLGIRTEEYDDGVLIYGDQVFQGGCVNAVGDHRVAMSFAIAGNIARDPVIIENCQTIATSFPNFMALSNTIEMQLFSDTQVINISIQQHEIPARN